MRFSPLETESMAGRSPCVPHVLPALSSPIDEDAALRVTVIWQPDPGCGPSPGWGQPAPCESVQAEGIHIIVIDVISVATQEQKQRGGNMNT